MLHITNYDFESPQQKYYPTEEAKIRGMAKEEILEILKNEDILKPLIDKLKAEIKAEILAELKQDQQQ